MCTPNPLVSTCFWSTHAVENTCSQIKKQEMLNVLTGNQSLQRTKEKPKLRAQAERHRAYERGAHLNSLCGPTTISPHGTSWQRSIFAGLWRQSNIDSLVGSLVCYKIPARIISRFKQELNFMWKIRTGTWSKLVLITY